MFGKFTFWLTLFAIAVTVVNYFGYDPDHMLLYMVSIPVWFLELFWDIHSMGMIYTYVLTILFYAAAGLFIDAMIAKYRRRA
ncbi:hypothetical protein [Ferviditalea candida]|uniref:Uncharacterized protein n=1 Tax=Ferviditalea candida TaxID=3108399 RepID=A0ABU5ZMU0_9BACL|nr:hypothetical protein [Paenibacillaceae bacterium T2]